MCINILGQGSVASPIEFYNRTSCTINIVFTGIPLMFYSKLLGNQKNSRVSPKLWEQNVAVSRRLRHNFTVGGHNVLYFWRHCVSSLTSRRGNTHLLTNNTWRTALQIRGKTPGVNTYGSTLKPKVANIEFKRQPSSPSFQTCGFFGRIRVTCNVWSQKIILSLHWLLFTSEYHDTIRVNDSSR